MPTTVYRSCPLCEATCGVAIELEGQSVLSVRGDDADPFSRGYICPKGTALGDLHADPDRLRRPMVREGASWREVEWDTAFDLVGNRLNTIRKEHGPHSLAVYQGNPSAHNLGLLTYGQLLLRTLGTRNVYSATSMDQLPHMLAALQMFGNHILMPVPDLDRTDVLICIGANPFASNGSIMTAPDIKTRINAIKERGQVIVLDPRRTETAEKASRHLFIKPATDAVLLLAMINVLFAESLVKPTRVPLARVGELRAAAGRWSPERAAAITGVPADEIASLARLLANTPRAVVYGRLGVCTQEFGGLASWLCYAVNALTGHLDEPGGLMFTTPAVDPVPLSALLGFNGTFGTFHSRVSKQPEFSGELPMTVLAEEIETPGNGQIRALLTSAGNPVLSTPGGPRLEKAFAQLDFMVSIDPYLNETTRLANVILPPASWLERSHYDVALNAFAIRNVAKYTPPTFERPAYARHDWEICASIWSRIGMPRHLGPGQKLVEKLLGVVGPEAIVEFALRAGPHGIGRGGLTLKKLRAAPHGIDLGPLESRLPKRLHTRDRRVNVAPVLYLSDLARLEARMKEPDPSLVMIGRRHLRSNNSWMHNSTRLMKGPPRCTLLIHPDDARARNLVEGSTAVVSTSKGSIEVPVEISDEMMPGVVSVPHGWGHTRRGSRLSVAEATPGASVNDIIDPARIDALSGTSALTGQPVEVRAR